jgi:hypothetical protein
MRESQRTRCVQWCARRMPAGGGKKLEQKKRGPRGGVAMPTGAEVSMPTGADVSMPYAPPGWGCSSGMQWTIA